MTIAERLIAIVPFDAQNGIDIHQIATLLGTDTNTAYQAGVFRVKDMVLFDTDGNRKYFCREHIAFTRRHTYFWTLDEVQATRYGWFRDKDQRTRAVSTRFIKQNAFGIGLRDRDRVSVAIAEAQVQINRIAAQMAWVHRHESADEVERSLLPLLDLVTTQARMYADIMDS